MANKNFKENKLKRFIAKSIQPILRVFNKRAYVSLQYRYITGHKLDWVNLERFTEKLQNCVLIFIHTMIKSVGQQEEWGQENLLNKKVLRIFLYQLQEFIIPLKKLIGIKYLINLLLKLPRMCF